MKRFDSGIIIPSDIEAIIFDMDGTLVDNMPLHIEAWIEAGKRFGVEVTASMIEEHSGTPTSEIVEYYNKCGLWSVDVEAFTLVKQELYREVKSAAGTGKLIEPMAEVIEYCKGKMPMSVGTGASRPNALSTLEELGVLNLMTIVVSADDVAKGKPHPEVFLKCSEAMQIDPSKCLVFEDAEKGIESAIAAGMPYIDLRPIYGIVTPC